MPAVGTPALEHGESIHLRQTEIEDNGAIIFRVAAKPSLLAVADGFDNVAARRERPAHVGGDAPIVFDQEDAHHFSFMRSMTAVLAST